MMKGVRIREREELKRCVERYEYIKINIKLKGSKWI